MFLLWRIVKTVIDNRITQITTVRVVLLAVILNLLFGTLFYFAERGVQDISYWDALWWAMVTMTTVGYGDFYAQTTVGRFFISYPCMLIGIGIIGYLVGAVAEKMIDRGSRKRRGLLRITMKEHIIICNFPGEQKVMRLLEEMARSHQYRDKEVVLISNEIDQLPQKLVKEKVRFVRGDAVREEILMQANIKETCGVFVLAEDSSDPASDNKTFAIGTQIEMIEREIGKPIKTVVELVSMDNMKMMQRSKVDGIVSADGIMDVLIAQEFLYPGLHDVIHEILSNASGSQFYILDTALNGQRFGDIQRKAIEFAEGVQVLGLERNGQKKINPDKNTIVERGDKLIVLADRRRDYEAFEKSLTENLAEELE